MNPPNRRHLAVLVHPPILVPLVPLVPLSSLSSSPVLDLELSSRRADQGGDEGEPQRAALRLVSIQETAAEDPVCRGAKGDRKREEPLYDPRPRRRAVHPCNSRFLRTTKVGSRVGPQAVPPKPDEDESAAGEQEADGDPGKEVEEVGGVSYRVSPHFLFPPHLSLRLLFLWSVFNLGKARRRQGELPRAAGGLIGVAADGERDRTVHNIAMIQ